METLFDEGFKDELTVIVKNLTPICVVIKKCQDAQVNVADATEMWLSLQLPTDEYNNIIRDRIKKAVHPVGYAAYLLHPKYKGALLNDDQMQSAITFLTDNMSNDAQDEFKRYVEDVEKLDRIIENCKNPISFWTLMESRYKNLSEFAIKLFLVPASTALVERLFSHWTYIHNLYRNRLTNVKSSKLVDIYHFLRRIKNKN